MTIPNRVTRGDVQVGHLERSGPSAVVGEEQLPGLPVRLHAARLQRQGDIKHNNVVGMVGDGAVHVPRTYRRCPVLDQRAYLLGVAVVRHLRCPSRIPTAHADASPAHSAQKRYVELTATYATSSLGGVSCKNRHAAKAVNVMFTVRWSLLRTSACAVSCRPTLRARLSFPGRITFTLIPYRPS